MHVAQKIIDGDRFVVLIHDGIVVLVYVEEEDRVCVYRARPDGQWDAEYFDHDGELLGSKTSSFTASMMDTVRVISATGDRVVHQPFIDSLLLMVRTGPVM